MKTALCFLTDGDWTLLRARSVKIRRERDEVIVAEGADARGIMVIESGSVRIEQIRDGATVMLARIGRGESFGEMSLLEETVASATVIAEEPTVIELFERGHVGALLESDPGLSTRFYRSIALDLSRRLRQSSKLVTKLNVQAGAQGNSLHATRLGKITTRQLPKDLVAGVGAFKDRMTALSVRAAPPAQADVDAACAALLALLQRSTTNDALFEMSYSDLGSFRGQDQLAVGVGAYVFRETFSWFMSAATVARTYMRPRGFADDYETMEMVYDAEPDGDGAVGPLIDQFYLGRPVCRARREGRDRVRAIARGVAEARGGAASIASLASGRGREAIELAADKALSALRVTCVDLDADALAAGARLAKGLRVAPRVAFVRADVVPSAEEPALTSIGRHDLAYALSLLEHLDDEACLRFLDAAFDVLHPGGTFAATTLSTESPDRLFMEHILEWSAHARTAADLEELFTRSRFAAKPRIEPIAGGAGWVVSIARAR